MSSIVIRELLTAYGFKTDTKDLEKADGRLAALKKTAIGMAALITGAGAAVTGVAKSFADTATAALDSSRILNISIEDYQELAHAAKNANSSVEGVTGAMDAMLRRMPRASKEGSDLNNLFKKLGVTLKDTDGNFRNRVDIFEDMIGALGAVEDLTERQVYQQMIFGTRASQVNTILIDGVEAFRRSREELRLYGVLIGEESAEQAKTFSDALGNVQTIIKGVRNAIGAELIPVFKTLSDQFTEWWLLNHEIVKSRISDWAKAGAAALRWFVEAATGTVKAVAQLIDWLGGLERILRVLAVIAAVWSLMHVINHIRWLIILLQLMGKGALLASLKGFFATVIAGFQGIGNSALVAYAKAMALPLAIAVAIVAVGLLIDDLWAFFNGHDSMIGELAKQWPWLAESMQAFKNAGEEIGDFFYHLSVLIPIWWGDFVDWFVGQGEEIGDFFYNLVGLIKIWWRELIEWFSSSWTSIVDGIAARIEALIGRLTALKDRAVEAISSIPGAGLVGRAASGVAGFFSGSSASAPESSGQSFVDRRLQSPEGAPAEGGVSIGGDNIDIQITQRPGEDADAFQARLMAEMRRERESQRRQTLDALQSGRRR